jgi:hypothetical protein
VSPTTLSFAGTNVGATSASQSVTVSNTGTTSLSITGVSLAGTDPQDFAETDGCSSSLAAGANCTITVTFTPAAAASLSATLQIADDADSSPQSVALSGTGDAVTPPNFGLSSTTPPQTVHVGDAAQFAVVVTPTNGAFTNSVSFSATGQPAGSTVSFSPMTVTPDGGPATTTMTVQTVAASAGLSSPDGKSSAPVSLALVALIPLSMRAFARAGRRRRRERLRTRLWRWCVLGIVATGVVAGCDGGFRLPGSSASSITYMITVTGTSGSDVQSTTVSLTVQP